MINTSQNSVFKKSDLYFVSFVIDQLQYGIINFEGNTVCNDDFKKVLKAFNLVYFDDSSPLSTLIEDKYQIDGFHFSDLVKNIIMVCNLGIFDKYISIPDYLNKEINDNIPLYSEKLTSKVDDTCCNLLYHIIFQFFIKEKCKNQYDYTELFSDFQISNEFYSFLDRKILFLINQSSNCDNHSCKETINLLSIIKDYKKINFPLDSLKRSLRK